MMTMVTMSILLLSLTMMIMKLNNTISMNSYMDREKSSPFECGFDPKNNLRIPFSLQFFLIALIFLIFDVEITLLIPLIMIMKMTNIANYSLITTFFLMILLMGLFHEWKQGALNWIL